MDTAHVVYWKTGIGADGSQMLRVRSQIESVRETVGQGVAMGIIAAKKKREREAAAADAARMNETEEAVSSAANSAAPTSKKQRLDPAADQQDGPEALAMPSAAPPSTTSTGSGAAASGTGQIPDEVPARVEVEQYASASDMLAACGPDTIKHALAQMGLKCGGTPEARAERLWSTKGKALSELDPRMFAKKKSGFKSQ